MCSDSGGILVQSNDHCDLHLQEHPIVNKLLYLHSNTESVMDSLEILFLASFLQLVSRMVFLVSRLFTISMSMRFTFLMTYSRTERKSIVYLTNFRLTPVSFCKK